ncbi:MAG TPA: NUDIX domain-containing protein [Candidatus Saccharibacteria bacterium]|nr:NUDIX domain-containing protein [Candidatus Saccharibacteria bacterium]
MSSLYDFKNTVAVKIIVKRGDKVLLIREPDFNDWMPNRLGLPGGKPLVNETLMQTIDRKVKADIGFEIDLKGIVSIENIIMPNSTVYHIILAADHVSGEIDTSITESTDVDWYSADQISKLTKDDFTEYYNDELLKNFLNDELTPMPLDYIYYQDNRSDDITKWMESGSNKP